MSQIALELTSLLAEQEPPSNELMDNVPQLLRSVAKHSGGAYGRSFTPKIYQGFQSPAYDPIGTLAAIYNSYLLLTEDEANQP